MTPSHCSVVSSYLQTTPLCPVNSSRCVQRVVLLRLYLFKTSLPPRSREGMLNLFRLLPFSTLSLQHRTRPILKYQVIPKPSPSQSFSHSPRLKLSPHLRSLPKHLSQVQPRTQTANLKQGNLTGNPPSQPPLAPCPRALALLTQTAHGCEA